LQRAAHAFVSVTRTAGFGDDGITTVGVPYLSIAVYLVLAGLAGVVAAIGPARRASRIGILKAIATE